MELVNGHCSVVYVFLCVHAYMFSGTHVAHMYVEAEDTSAFMFQLSSTLFFEIRSLPDPERSR